VPVASRSTLCKTPLQIVAHVAIAMMTAEMTVVTIAAMTADMAVATVTVTATDQRRRFLRWVWAPMRASNRPLGSARSTLNTTPIGQGITLKRTPRSIA